MKKGSYETEQWEIIYFGEWRKESLKYYFNGFSSKMLSHICGMDKLPKFRRLKEWVGMN